MNMPCALSTDRGISEGAVGVQGMAEVLNPISSFELSGFGICQACRRGLVVLGCDRSETFKKLER